MTRLRSTSSRAVDRLTVEKGTVFWDREVTGFGVIGAEEARCRASLIIGRIRAGEEPVPEPLAANIANGPKVADLTVCYMAEHVAVRCKPATEKTFRSMLDVRVLPAFGKVPVAAVGRKEALKYYESLARLPTTANMAVKMLSHMFTMAETWGIIEEGTNPWRFVTRYPTGRRERFLTDAEYERLGEVLKNAESGARGGGASAAAVAAIRLLMLTSCRTEEILGLKWEDVDLEAGELRLSDAKTGARTVSLVPKSLT